MSKQQKSINVIIGLNGEVEISAEGYKGKGCEAASKFLEDALGMNPKGRKKLPDYYASETVAQQQRT